MRTPALLLALLLLVQLVSSNHAAGWRSRRLLQKPSYSNLLAAAQSEVQVIQQLYNGVFREQGWANTEDFRPLLKVALTPTSNLTAFFPSDDSWQRVADHYCLTQQGVLDNISNLREMLANYIKAHLVANLTLHSRDFRDGMVLQSMAMPTSASSGTAVNHTLSKVVTNGTVKWVFKNASIYKIAGTYDYEDIHVNPQRMDIKAGNSIIHVIDTLFRNHETERFWEGLRQQVLDRAGLPINNPKCPSNQTFAQQQDAFAPSQIAGMVIGVVIGLLLLAGVLMLIFMVRASDGSFLGPLKSLSKRNRRTDDGASSSPAGDRDGDSPGSGSGEVFTSPLLHASAPHSSRLAHQSTGGSSVLTNGNWATRASGSSQNSSMLVHTDSVTDAMSVVNEESPFATGSNNVQQLPIATLVAGMAGMAVMRQSSSITGDNGSDNDTNGRATDSIGSGTPFVSKGSVHGCRKDLAALAAAGAAAGGTPVHHARASSAVEFFDPADAPLYDSLGAPLVPSESVPMGRINHEHVIPFSELSLRELIGSGAEGKVYRGTWKHTDIAAKEYLPIEPAADVPTGSNKDSPSDAAMAHARTALAKEVHWLTSLNHPNLVRFCAVCLERPLVVMEFYKHGSVFAMLQKAARELIRSQQTRRKGYVAHFNWDRRLEMLHDVAAGMSYLHGKDHVHGDLRSPNLFVGADGKVKIGDFGFTKRLACNTASLKVKRITHPRWVAPELMMDNMMSRASDVYSFGIIMYELLTFRIPFDLLGKEQVVINVVQGFRPDVPEEEQLPPGTSSSTCLFTYVRLMQECWAHDPAARPSFEVIARRLKAMQRWRKIISKHSTLHRAASALRQSSSCSSLTKQQTGGSAHNGSTHNGSPSPYVTGSPQVPASPQVTGVSGDGSVTPSANGNGHSRSSMARARSIVLSPGTDSGVLPPRPPREGSLPSQVSQSAVPDYSSSDYEDDSLPEIEEFEDADTMQAHASAPVSEAVVAGTRLAVIGVGTYQDEQSALASVAGDELSLARKVVLVGSDLPAGTFGRQSLRTGGSSEEARAKRFGSFTGPTGAVVQGDAAHRCHSVTIGSVSRQQQQAEALTAVAAAAALASAAATAASQAAAPKANGLPPNGKTAAAAAARGGMAPVVPPVKTAAPAAAAAAAAATAAAAAAQQAAAAGKAWGSSSSSKSVQRRHSDPMPGKTRMSAEEPTVVSPECPDSAMTSGQSPFAYVTVAPPGLGDYSELLQVQQQQQHATDAVQQAEDKDPGMRLIQSYPLYNPTSDAGSSLQCGASPTPDPAWQQQHGKHGLRHTYGHHGSGNVHVQRMTMHVHVQHMTMQQQSQGLLQQQQAQLDGQQAQLIGQHLQQLDEAVKQQQGQQRVVAQESLTAAGSCPELGALKSRHGSAAALAAAADAADDDAVSDGSAGEASGEVFTPFDSPFYQDLTWAPSASVCGMDSNHGSFSVGAGPLSVGHVSSAVMVASGTVCGSDSGSMGSPFQHMLQLQQAGLWGGVVPGSGSMSAGPDSSSLQGPSLQDPSVALHSSGEPVLREALTIAYQAGLTPMAAAAVEAVSLHQNSRRSISITGQPGSRPSSFVEATSPQEFNSVGAMPAGAMPAGVWAQLATCNGQRSEASGVTPASSNGGSRQDVAASADNSVCGAAAPAPALAATAAASVVVEGLAGKPHAAHAAAAKSPVRSTTPVSDQQQSQVLRSWASLKDAPPTGAAVAAAGGAGVAGEEGVQRPAWMRLLGIRRSLPGGA